MMTIAHIEEVFLSENTDYEEMNMIEEALAELKQEQSAHLRDALNSFKHD